MIILSCIGKIRDKNGRITDYKLEDKAGKTYSWKAEKIKQAIYNVEVKVSNLTLTQDGRLVDSSKKSNKGITIETRNTNAVGKPGLISFNALGKGKLSGTQKRILERLKQENPAYFNKKKDNISIDMKDMSCLTAYSGVEYSLFSRQDGYYIFRGNEGAIHISDDWFLKLFNGKYKWTGHTHPGQGIQSLVPSGADYDTLERFNQESSLIYNSVGSRYKFGRSDNNETE
ncbi:MAG: hypothetical protein K6C13_11810 [Oscillospiraceae bacterium]|nr:hypothetical protein [Oscillospiraceae bacterium]